MYDYREAVLEDARDAIEDSIEGGYVDKSEISDTDKFFDYFYDELWVDDSVTGNAFGSYTFNSARAAEYVSDNLDLLREAYEEFGEGEDEAGRAFLNGEWEAMDVTIRCYLLSNAISEICSEYEENGFFDDEEEEQENG